MEVDPPSNCDRPTQAEMQVFVRKLKGGKAPCVRGIHDEFLKAGGEAVEQALHIILCSFWNPGMIPADCKSGIIAPL